jgi:hypothetical protein
MSGQTFVLGQPVEFTWALRREVAYPANPSQMGRRERWKVWTAGPAFPGQPEPEWRDGIVVGERTLADGMTVNEEYGYTFLGRNYFRAYLVVSHLRQKPVLVRPDHMRPKPGF